jgi:hypothetical protein
MGIFSEHFEQILEKPEMYVGEKSLTKISYYLQGYRKGYQYAKQQYEDDEIMNGFQKYVVDRYKLGVNHNWAHILLFMERSEYRAFDRAKQLWSEYKTQIMTLNDNE